MAIIKTQAEGINLADTFAFTGTVTGAGGVNTPYFHAYLGSDQSLSNNTVTKAQVNTEVVDSVFWGLFGSTTKTTYTPIDGFLYSEELGQVLITIVGFYFGNAAASRKT